MYKTERFNSIIMLNRLMSQFTTKIYFMKKEHFKFIYVNTKNVKNLHLPNFIGYELSVIIDMQITFTWHRIKMQEPT